MLLQEGVSVLDLVQCRHGVLELLQPPPEVLLGPRASGEVRLHHLAQGEVVACIRTLANQSPHIGPVSVGTVWPKTPKDSGALTSIRVEMS